MLIYFDAYNRIQGLGARIDRNIGVIFTSGTIATEVIKNNVFTLSDQGSGFFSDDSGRRFYDTENGYLGGGAGDTSISTWGDAVTRVGRTKLSYIGNKVVKIDSVELSYFGDLLTVINGVRLSYFGERLTKIGQAEISYSGERVLKIGDKYI